ncbi:MAG TPA: cation-transporting P-type ATPase [Burkholderiales bacterium]|nr:cation-transporting P-type ATPase [Burkholderiales bacterium]
MKIQQLGMERALASLNSGPDGLSAFEARRRLREFGPNRVEAVARDSLWLRFAREFIHFFALILWIAAGLAFYAEWNDPGKGMGTLGAAIIGVIFVNGVFSFWQEFRAEKALAALRNLLPPQVTALRDGQALRLPAQDLVPGDLILLEAGDNIPADCRLVQAFGVRVNNANVTGESLPKARTSEPSAEEDLLRAKNLLLAGTAMVSGNARALVFATGMHTEFGKIAHLTQTGREHATPLQREITRLSRVVAGIATALGAVFFVIGQFLGLPFWENFIFAIGIIVANVPEGLLPTVTLSLAMATQRMAKRNALVRHLPAVETLGAATVICTDKTGTLTLNRMAVKQVFLPDGPRGPGFDSGAGGGHRRFLEAALHCQNLREVNENGIARARGDPMEVALAEMARPALGVAGVTPRTDELPFDADRKRMSTVHATPEGLTLYCKGALELMLPLCSAVETAGGPAPLTPQWRERFLGAQEAMAQQGLRVLALAWRRLPEGLDREQWERDLVLTGLAGLEDPPRPEVPDAIRRCREAGIKVIMVTGDHPHTARAIAREIGLVRSADPVVITGDELRRMAGSELQLALDAPEILFARVAADQKMIIVQALRRKKQVVAVTGDGVNDAPALRRADIGIAMGGNGTDVAREAADIVLLDDNFASIVNAVEEGRTVYQNIRKFMTYILTSNVPEIVPYLAFVALRIPLPLTVIQILAVDLGTDMVPALALGAEKPEPDSMRRPPRARRERLLDWQLLGRAYLFLGAMEAVAAMAAFFFVLNQGGWSYGDPLGTLDPLYLQATTACLAAIISMQVVNVFLCRHPTESAFRFGLFSNRLLLLGIAVEVALILAIVYTPWGNAVFGTAPLEAKVWLYMLPFALAMLGLEELRKLIARRLARKR